MATLPLVVGLLLAAQPAPQPGFSDEDNWWDCQYALPPAEGGTPWGHLYRSFTLTGEGGPSGYNQWGPELRLTGRVADTPEGARAMVSTLGVQFPQTVFSRTGGAVHADLLGDDRLIATAMLIGAREARRGISVANAYFEEVGSRPLGPALAAADRWTLVVRQDDGAELLRRDLPVAGRGAREDVFAGHYAALRAAWRARDPDPLAVHPAGSARCRLSTPGSREEERAREERGIE